MKIREKQNGSDAAIRVRLSDIPREGLKISDTIDLTQLNGRMDEGRGNDIVFTREPTVELLIELERDHMKSGATVRGTIATAYDQPCPKCLESINRSVVLPVDFIFKPRRGSATEEDDIGIAFFDGEHVELDELLQEALILSVSPFGLEHEDCPGYVDSAEVTEPSEGKSNLGDLLRAAGVVAGKATDNSD